MNLLLRLLRMPLARRGDGGNGRQALALYLASLLLCSVAFVSLFNRFLSGLGEPRAQAMAFALSCAIVALILFVSSIFRTLGYLVLIYYSCLAVLEYYIVSIGIRDPNSLITNLMETDLHEISGFIGWQAILAFLATLLSSIVLVRLVWWLAPEAIVRRFRPNSRSGMTKAFLLLISLGLLGFFVKKPPIELEQERFVQAALWPIFSNLQALRTAKGYYFGEMQFAKRIAAIPSPANSPSIFEDRPDGMTVVFVFGESVRAQNWGLNGYARNTTPKLAKESGIVNFTDVLSFGTYTEVSAIGMMTAATFRQPVPAAGSFVDLFVKHGFDTAAFIASRPTSVQHKLLSAVKNQTIRQGPAMDLLPAIQDYVAKPGNKDKFLFIYTQGNHFPYNRNYSTDYAHFTPDDHGRTNFTGETQKLINAYDNSIVYTDAFLDAVIGTLRNRRAILIYVSDHGDALGEDGNFIRGGGMTKDYLRRVPLFVWTSSAYERGNPDYVRAMRTHSKLRVSQEFIFPTILSLAGIRSPLVNPRRDLTSPLAQPRDFEVGDEEPKGSVFQK